MEKKYTYSDYEDAYYVKNIKACKDVGWYLLSFINTDEAKRLSKKLAKLELPSYINMEDKKEMKKVKAAAKLLLDVKLLLMVNK